MSQFTNSKILAAVATEMPSLNIAKSFDDSHAVIAGEYLFVRSIGKITIYHFDDRHLIKLKPAAIVEFSNWEGDILLIAIKNSGLFTEPDSSAPLSVRLSRWHDAKPIYRIDDVMIWKRSLLGEPVDYCATIDGLAFHAATLREAASGLDNQIKSAYLRRNKTITIDNFNEPSFIEAGIIAFREAFLICKMRNALTHF